MTPGWISGFAPDGSPWKPRGSWGVYASHIGSYMLRWIIQTPLGMVRLHRILRPDAGRDLHDHPFDFTSLILAGGYAETLQVNDEVTPRYVARVHLAGAIVRRRATDLHRITAIIPGALTLVLAGPKRRTWGFLTPTRWVPFYDYRGQA